MSTNTVPVCPSGCYSIMPYLDFSFCSPENAFGEITHIFLASSGAKCFSNWLSLAEWTARLDNDSASIDAIRFMHVKADLPAGSRDLIETSLGRKSKTPSAYVINLDIDDVSDLNYDFMRLSQCNTQFKMWYVTNDYIFGGVCGIDVLLNLDYKIDRGSKTIQLITGTITWEDPYAAERGDNPLSGTTLSD